MSSSWDTTFFKLPIAKSRLQTDVAGSVGPTTSEAPVIEFQVWNKNVVSDTLIGCGTLQVTLEHLISRRHAVKLRTPMKRGQSAPAGRVDLDVFLVPVVAYPETGTSDGTQDSPPVTRAHEDDSTVATLPEQLELQLSNLSAWDIPETEFAASLTGNKNDLYLVVMYDGLQYTTPVMDEAGTECR